MPRGDPPSDLLKRNGEAFGCCPAVDDEGVDGVLPQRGLPPAGIAEQIGLEAAPQASCGVEGVLAVAMLYAAAEPHLRQVVLSQPLVLERLGAGRTSKIQRRDSELEQRDVRGELAWHVVGSRSGHQVVDVVASCQTRDHRNLCAAMKDVGVDALPLRHRNSVAESGRQSATRLFWGRPTGQGRPVEAGLTGALGPAARPRTS
jgi:hypothetical protein